MKSLPRIIILLGCFLSISLSLPAQLVLIHPNPSPDFAWRGVTTPLNPPPANPGDPTHELVWTSLVPGVTAMPDFSMSGMLTVPNQEDLKKIKRLWVGITFASHSAIPLDDQGNLLPLSVTAFGAAGNSWDSTASGTLLDDYVSVVYFWEIQPQPAYEIINMDDLDLTLDDVWLSNPLYGMPTIVALEVASSCVPEPSTVAWIGLAALGLLALLRRRPARA